MLSDPLPPKSYNTEISSPSLHVKNVKRTFFPPYNIIERPYHVTEITSQWLRG